MKPFYYLLFTIFSFSLSGAFASESLARILYENGSHDDVLVSAYKNGSIQYRINARAINSSIINRNQYQSIYFYKPAIYSEAMALYRDGKYAKAKEKFLECERAYRSVDTAPGNYSSKAGFYSMECSRQLEEYATLEKERASFLTTGINRKDYLQQIELYIFWDALRLQEWKRIELLAKEWEKRSLSGAQRVQVAYCYAVALDNLSKENPKLVTEALNAYNRVFTADFGASRELLISAANNLLAMYSRQPDVELAIKRWNKPDEQKASEGYQRLLEANAIAQLYEDAGFGKIKPLNQKYKKFLRYSNAKK